MKKVHVVAILFLLFTAGIKAQQLPLYSQYMFNKFLLNPAVAGSDGYTSLNLTAREQWIGIDHSPRTHSLSYQTRILKKSFIIKSTSVKKKIYKPSTEGRVGIGGYVFDDRNGLVSRTGFQFTYAYHIWLDETQLSFGLAGTAFQFRINDEKLTFFDQSEPLLSGDLRKTIFVPDANFGVYLLNFRYYVGFSVAQLFQSYLKIGNAGLSDYRMLRHYYLSGGYTFPLQNDYYLEPSILIKTTEELLYQIDFNVKLQYKEDYWIGLSYRTAGAVVLLAGVRLDKFYFGYAFDYTLSSIMKHSLGSHEFMMAVKFGDSARRYPWLDRY
ncbi:MAG: type IX secretion system membrane protein PorP/SprF [Bacteroidetes bacterium]|nr:type IX secretion system membrane protein PorP/SprF [Bacteroidota bacterium]